MSNLAYAKSHRDLIVYQKTRALANEIFILTKSFPKEEMYSLTDQIRLYSVILHPVQSANLRRNTLKTNWLLITGNW